MSQLTFQSIPGFTDIPDANLAADKVVTDDMLVTISQNAKFGAVRFEVIFMGFFKHGDTVGLPVSPVDGYEYSREETMMHYQMYSTRAPAAGFISGQANPPFIAAGQPANLYWWIANIEDTTGVVNINVSYFMVGGAETITNDGIVKVFAMCQRESDNGA